MNIRKNDHVEYEFTGNKKETMEFLSNRGIDDAWFFGLESYYDLR